MPVIDTSPEALLVLCNRLGRELGAAQVGSFALEEQLSRAEMQFAELRAQLAQANENVQAMRAKLVAAEAVIEGLRQNADPERAKKMARFAKANATRTP